MSAIILSKNKVRQVKNLGWLLRNWKFVKQIGFNYPFSTGATNSNLKDDGELWARLEKDGKQITYLTSFASLSVCWNWLNRPILKTVPFVFVYGLGLTKQKNFEIGNDEWIRINKLKYKEFFEEVLK